jgi:hypothetical protein
MARFITRVADQCRQRAAEERFLKRFGMTAPEGAADDEAAGPGWYESSRELETGLLVRESTPGDDLLAAWHEASRGYQRSVAVAVALRGSP